MRARLRCVPERPGNAVLVGLVGALQQGGGPRPVTDDVDGDETRLNGAAAGVEVFRALVAAAILLIDPHHRLQWSRRSK